jgi:hypothetical protein
VCVNTINLWYDILGPIVFYNKTVKVNLKSTEKYKDENMRNLQAPKPGSIFCVVYVKKKKNCIS